MCVLWVVVVLHQGNQGEEQRHVQGEDGAYSWFRLRLVFYTGCDLLDRMVGDTERVKPSYQPTRLLAECLRGLLVQGSMNRQIPPCAMKYSLNSCGHLSVVERSRVMGKVGGGHRLKSSDISPQHTQPQGWDSRKFPGALVILREKRLYLIAPSLLSSAQAGEEG